MPSTLVLGYDAEDPRCRRLVDWVGARDREGLVVAFPFQNGELVRIAPELAGRIMPGEIHTLDMETRETRLGASAIPGILRRLPAWAWLGPAAGFPWVGRLIFGLARR
jgi:hypothetical protein